MKNLDDAAIDYIEKFIKNDLMAILDKQANKNTNEEITNNEMFYGKIFASNPGSFQFSLGEKYQLKEIAAHVTTMINSEGITYFGKKNK